MKKLICLIFAAIIITTVFPLGVKEADCVDIPDISAKAAVLISADTGEIVYERDPYKKLPMASTTKIMTTLLCIESGGLDEEFVVDSEAIKVEGSSMGLREGDIVTKYALCCGMLLPSGNDAANAAAVKIAGSIEAFAEMMNDRAAELGLSRTFFVTPSGLEGEGHGSSAYDMAILAREALKNDTFREICSQSSIQTEFGAPPYKRWLKNTNKLLGMYEGVYGVKTGFTDEAGRCLVSACERDGKKLICVTLNDRNDWQDHTTLYDYGFGKVKLITAKVPYLPSLDLVGAEKDMIGLCAKEPYPQITALDCRADELEYSLISSPFIYAPVKAGDMTAELRLGYKGREICRIPLYAAEDADYSITDKCEKRESNIFRKAIKRIGEFVSR